jgi:hypothetical protein
MSKCTHNYDSYNGYYRCTLCDDRIHEGEYQEYIHALVAEQAAEIKRLKMLARRVLSCPMPPEINALAKALEDS